MKAKKIILLSSLLLIFTVLFCTVCTGFQKAKSNSNSLPELSETVCITESASEPTTQNNENEPSALYEAPETTADTTERTCTETTRTPSLPAPKPTTAPFTTRPETSSSPMKDALVNGEWHFTTPNGGINCRFFSDCTYEIYDEYGNIDDRGYYCIDGNILYVYDSCGNVINCFEYNKNTNEFTSLLPPCETTAATAHDSTPELNDSNAPSLLWYAVECYDMCVNCTTFNLEYSYFGEYITCPHCGGEAFLVLNYNSCDDIKNYINDYLCGDAKEAALDYFDDISRRWAMLTEQDGKLYVCGAYNEKGYCGLDYNSIRIVSENSDGSYTIAVDDIDYEETYYLDVYYVDGEYKIG